MREWGRLLMVACERLPCDLGKGDAWERVPMRCSPVVRLQSSRSKTALDFGYLVPGLLVGGLTSAG